MHLTRRISMLLVVMLLLAACGGATTPSTAAEGAPEAGGDGGGSGGDNACLNTVEEVSAAFGVEVTEAENTTTPGGGASCIYYIDKETFEIAYTVGLSPGGGVAQTIFDSFSADENAEAASGIGDEAVWYGGVSWSARATDC